MNDRVTGRSNARNPRQFARISDNTFILFRLSRLKNDSSCMESFALYSLAFGKFRSAQEENGVRICNFNFGTLDFRFFFFFAMSTPPSFLPRDCSKCERYEYSLASGTAAYEYEKVQSRGEVFLHTKVKTIRIVNSICRYKCAANLFP